MSETITIQEYRELMGISKKYPKTPSESLPGSDKLIFKGDIVAKPRMTRSDKWKERPATSKYWAFKDLLNVAAKQQRFTLGDRVYIVAQIPVPKSWSEKKKKRMDGQPHQVRPDVDNLNKSIFDCLLREDSNVWEVHIKKTWINSEEGILTIYNLK